MGWFHSTSILDLQDNILSYVPCGMLDMDFIDLLKKKNLLEVPHMTSLTKLVAVVRLTKTLYYRVVVRESNQRDEEKTLVELLNYRNEKF